MNDKKYLYEEIQNFLVNVGWINKIQICQVDVYTEFSRRLKLAKIILTALTSVGLGSFILKIFPNIQDISMTITFAISLATTIVIALDKENDYKKLAEQNKVAADKFLEMRNKATALLYKMKYEEDIAIIEKEFLELKELRNQANPDLPYTSSKAVALASKKLKENKDNVYNDDYKLFISKNLLDLEGDLWLLTMQKL